MPSILQVRLLVWLLYSFASLHYQHQAKDISDFITTKINKTSPKNILWKFPGIYSIVLSWENVHSY